VQLQGLTIRPADGKTGPSAIYSYGPSGTTRTTLLIGVSPDTAADHLGASVHVGSFHGEFNPPGDLELSDGHTYLSLNSVTDIGNGPYGPEAGDTVYGLAQLRTLAGGLRVATNGADPTTWYDAASATS